MGFHRLFDIERIDREPIDFYNNPIVNIGAVQISNIPAFLTSSITEKGYDYNNSGMSFGPVTDGDIELASKDSVMFYVMDVTAVVSKLEFFLLLKELSQKALEAVDLFDLKARGLVDDKWVQDVKELLPALEEKIQQYV